MSIGASLLDVSYKWNHISIWLLFTYNVNNAYLCCGMKLYFIPFYGQVILHCMDRPHFVDSSVDGHLACLYFLVITNNAAVNIHVQIFVQTYLLGKYISRCRITGS